MIIHGNFRTESWKAVKTNYDTVILWKFLLKKYNYLNKFMENLQ